MTLYLKQVCLFKLLKNNKALIRCLEEIAFNNGWISRDMILAKAKTLYKTSYGTYLKKIIDLNTGEN